MKLTPGVWKWVTWAVGLGVLVVGVSTLPDFRGNEFTVVVTLGMGGWVTLVGPFVRVSVDARGLRYWGVFKWKRFRWAEVAAIGVQPLGGNGLMDAEAPVVKTMDGRETVLTAMAGYSRGASSTSSPGGRCRGGSVAEGLGTCLTGQACERCARVECLPQFAACLIRVVMRDSVVGVRFVRA